MKWKIVYFMKFTCQRKWVIYSFFRAHLTATLPMLEPFTPTESRRVSFPHSPSSSFSSTTSSSPSLSATMSSENSREEFMRRRSLFQAAGQHKEPRTSSSERTKSSFIERSGIFTSPPPSPPPPLSTTGETVVNERGQEEAEEEDLFAGKDFLSKSTFGLIFVYCFKISILLLSLSLSHHAFVCFRLQTYPQLKYWNRSQKTEHHELLIGGYPLVTGGAGQCLHILWAGLAPHHHGYNVYSFEFQWLNFHPSTSHLTSSCIFV